MGCSRQQDQLTDCCSEPLMNAFTMFCEPPAASRACALPTFGRVGLTKGCGAGKSAVAEPLASDGNGGWNEEAPRARCRTLLR